MEIFHPAWKLLIFGLRVHLDEDVVNGGDVVAVLVAATDNLHVLIFVNSNR